MKWLDNLFRKDKPKRKLLPHYDGVVEHISIKEINRCPVCGWMLSRNLKGTVEIKCKKCKNIIKITKE